MEIQFCVRVIYEWKKNKIFDVFGMLEYEIIIKVQNTVKLCIPVIKIVLDEK